MNAPAAQAVVLRQHAAPTVIQLFTSSWPLVAIGCGTTVTVGTALLDELSATPMTGTASRICIERTQHGTIVTAGTALLEDDSNIHRSDQASGAGYEGSGHGTTVTAGAVLCDSFSRPLFHASGRMSLRQNVMVHL